MNISLLLLLRFLYKARNETINNNIDKRYNEYNITLLCIWIANINNKTPNKSANNE